MAADLPTGPRGRLLALAVTALLLAAAWFGAAAPLLAWGEDLEARLAARGALAARMEGLADSLPLLRRAAAEAEAAGAGAGPALLEGATDAEAGAALQVRVRALAERAGVALESAEALPAEAAGVHRRIGMRIAATAPWPALVGLLGELERAGPGLLVDDLQLQAAPVVVGTVRPLAATLAVLGFRAADPAGRPAGQLPVGTPGVLPGGAP